MHIENRPDSFDDIIGQDHIIDGLKDIIKSIKLGKKNYPKSMIFSGPFGCGKTLTAYTFINELNKATGGKWSKHEFDSAIFRKVDQMEDIKFKIDNVFSFSSNSSIILFEEIQEVSPTAQGLLLKTLENFENSNTHFIFTTTDISKLLPTIQSRSLPLKFKLVKPELIKNKILQLTAEDEDLEKEVPGIIAKYSRGHMRDAIQLLDLYYLNKGLFYESTIHLYDKLKHYIFGPEQDVSDILCYNSNDIQNNLNMLMEDFISHNVEEHFTKCQKLFEEFCKYKNFVENISDISSLLRILKKFYSGLR